ncbi:MAG: hypothetical protein RLZZ200_188 [Pseudomonadota bacterium]|jgi:signal transduction histidine kinase
MAIITLTMVALAMGRPALLSRTLLVIGVVDGLGCLLLLAKSVPLPLRSSLLIAGILVLVCYLSLAAGGIRSPAAATYFYLPLLATVLMGWGGALAASLAVLVACAGLVIAEQNGLIGEATVRFGPLGYLGIIFMHTALALSLLMLATRTLAEALRKARTALAEREASDAARERTQKQLIQAQRMDSLGKLAGGIAHDFSNLLLVLRGNLDTACEAVQGNAAARAALAETVNAASRAQDLTKRLLLFARGEQGQQLPLSLQTVVEDTLRLLRSHLPPEILVETRFEPGLPLVVGDATQLQQVVMNLCINAAQAMDMDAGRLTLSVGQSARGPGNFLELRISDTGAGMPAEVRDRIFEPFFSTKGDQGSGLGLSIVHGIVFRHGGDISVESEPGLGTTFRIHLPVP